MKLALLSIFLANLFFFAKSQTWTRLDTSEIENNPLIKDLLNFGLNLIIEEGQRDEMILDNDLVLDEIDSVEIISSCELKYRYHVVMGNEKGAILTAVFIVNYNPETGEKSLDDEYRGFEYESSNADF